MIPTYGHMTPHDPTSLVPRLRPKNVLSGAWERGYDPINAGILQVEQWLIEGNYTEEEALTQSIDMLAAGIDTVGALDITCTSKSMMYFTYG